MSFNPGLGDSTPLIPIPNVLTADLQTLLHPDSFGIADSAPFTVPGGILNPNTVYVPTIMNPNPQPAAAAPSNMWLIVGSIAATFFFFGKRRR